MSERVRILLIEDNALIAMNLKDVLEKTAKGYEVSVASTLAAGLEHLSSNPTDLVLLDLMLPDSEGFQTFLKISVLVPNVPIIVLTGVDDETFAVNAMRHGAQDYLVKGTIDGPVMVKAVRYAIERKRIEEDLRKARTELEHRVNERTTELLDINENLQKEILERSKTEEALKKAYEQLKHAQAQLIFSEKMETIGRLAAGVAHEVKNPLAILLQCVEYIGRVMDSKDEKVGMTLKYMTEAIGRADNIVKGLLDFSSISKLELREYRPEEIVDNTLMLMKNEFDKHHIRIEKNFSPDLPNLSVDKNRCEQVLLNILMNSVDAMADGGVITISLSTKVIDSIGDGCGRRGQDSFRIGEKTVVFDITDTGPGIPVEIMDKIFDPFFTTKQGKGGTGLGLSTIKNIIDLHNGRITIKNRKPQGVEVQILFRAC